MRADDRRLQDDRAVAVVVAYAILAAGPVDAETAVALSQRVQLAAAVEHRFRGRAPHVLVGRLHHLRDPAQRQSGGLQPPHPFQPAQFGHPVPAAVAERPGLHLLELALDVLGWLALTAAGLVLLRLHPLLVTAGGLITAAGVAGMLHDAGNLAVTHLVAAPGDHAVQTAATATLWTAKWGVNIAGMLWISGTAAALLPRHLPAGFRITGTAALACGIASVALPWLSGSDGPDQMTEQIGYALFLPIMVWYAAWAVRLIRRRVAG